MGAPGPAPLIAVDLDDVLIPFMSDFVEWHKKEHPGEQLPDENAVLHPSSPLRASFLNFHENTSPDEIPGALESLKRLQASGLRLEVVTSRPLYRKQDTEQLMNQRFPGIFTAIHFTEGHDKGATLKRIGASVLVDDMVHNVTDAVANGIATVLFDLNGSYYWSQSAVLGPSAVRCLSWEATTDWILAHIGRTEQFKAGQEAAPTTAQVLENVFSRSQAEPSQREHRHLPLRSPILPFRPITKAPTAEPSMTAVDGKSVNTPPTKSLSNSRNGGLVESTETLLDPELNPTIATNGELPPAKFRCDRAHDAEVNECCPADCEASSFSAEAASVEESLRAELHMVTAELESPAVLRSELHKSRQKVQELEKEAEQMLKQLNEAQVDSEKHCAQIEEQQHKQRKQQEALEKQQQQVTELETELFVVSAQVQKANQTTENLEQKLREAEAALDGEKTGLTWCVTELQDQLAATEKRAEVAEKALEEMRCEAREQAIASEVQMRAAEERIEQMQSDMKEQAAATEAQRTASNLCVMCLQQQLDKAKDHAEAEKKNLSSRLASLQKQLKESNARAKDADARAEKFQKKLSEMEQATEAQQATAESSAVKRANMLQRQLKDSNERAREAEARARDLEKKLLEMEATASKRRTSSSKVEHAIGPQRALTVSSKDPGSPRFNSRLIEGDSDSQVVLDLRKKLKHAKELAEEDKQRFLSLSEDLKSQLAAADEQNVALWEHLEAVKKSESALVQQLRNFELTGTSDKESRPNGRECAEPAIPFESECDPSTHGLARCGSSQTASPTASATSVDASTKSMQKSDSGTNVEREYDNNGISPEPQVMHSGMQHPRSLEPGLASGEVPVSQLKWLLRARHMFQPSQTQVV